MQNNFPNGQDKLFKDKLDLNTGAWLNNTAGKFFLYSEGYRLASKTLYEQCLEQPILSNKLVYSIIDTLLN